MFPNTRSDQDKLNTANSRPDKVNIVPLANTCADTDVDTINLRQTLAKRLKYCLRTLAQANIMNNYVDSIKCLGKLPFKETTRQIVPAYPSANKCWDKKISSSGKSAQVGPISRTCYSKVYVREKQMKCYMWGKVKEICVGKYQIHRRAFKQVTFIHVLMSVLAITII